MNKKMNNIEKLTEVCALLVYTAKIDDDYTDKEKKIISLFIKSQIKDENDISKIMEEAEKLEKDSNHLLKFTNIIKQETLESKSAIIQELWKTVLSDGNVDDYEANIMRRICGLIYFPDKLSGEIKLNVIKTINSK
mgnify:CR=1 FL=1|tara:strand:- start:633 stop:1040 length:408 start_codon:yes stop_codon:yes gene_type:complete